MAFVGDDLCNTIKKTISETYAEGKEYGAAQERREIIEMLNANMVENAQGRWSMGVNAGIEYAVGLIKRRSQGEKLSNDCHPPDDTIRQPDTNASLPQQPHGNTGDVTERRKGENRKGA